MNDFKLIDFNASFRGVWDYVVTNSKNGNFLHLRDYIEYHSHRFEEASLIIEKNGKPVAVIPCNREGAIISSYSGLTYGGLIYGTNLRASEVLEIIFKISAHYKNIGAKHFRYKAIPHVFHKYPAEEDLYALSRLNARIYRRDLSSVIDLRKPIKLSDSRKSTIRKAEKFGVKFMIDGDIVEFHNLLTNVLEKFGAKPVHTIDELIFLKSRFEKNIRLYTAQNSFGVVAGALVYDFGATVHTQYLGTSDEGREVGALDFVLHKLINNIYADRNYFSFGISTEDEGQKLNESLIFQKEGFGARAIIHDFYEWDLI